MPCYGYDSYATMDRGVSFGKLVIVIIVLAAIYLLVAYFMKWAPFQETDPIKAMKANKSYRGYSSGKSDCPNYESCMVACQDDYCMSGDPYCDSCIVKCGTCEAESGNNDDDNEFTGNCVQYDNPGDGPYGSQAECNAAVSAGDACQNPDEYWGCSVDSYGAPTGECQQYDTAEEGPFPDESTCKADSSCNLQYWGCESA